MTKEQWINRGNTIIEKVKDLYRKGERTDEIARKVNISQGQVVSILEMSGLINY